MQNIKNLIPDYAKDLRMNLGNVLESEHLDEVQVYGTVVAVAMATRNATLIEEAMNSAATHLSDTELAAAKTAAALMGMNNIYYRFSHLVSADMGYLKMPPRLRMNGIREQGSTEETFELWSLAVSAVNGCGLYMDSHTKKVENQGTSKEKVQDTIRIAAVLHGIATVLDTEAAVVDTTAQAA